MAGPLGWLDREEGEVGGSVKIWGPLGGLERFGLTMDVNASSGRNVWSKCSFDNGWLRFCSGAVFEE